ncbi:MAG: DUF2807 domain-containing protein [Lentimicrobiaceae bacterium]|nr:DUF2807 domain-containing protein [Lentimicrobiaceae bacterium]
MKKNNGIFWGLLFVAFGLLWLGRSLGFFHFSWYNALRLWPILIIWVGVTLLPIAQLWKNVCNFILLAIAIVLLFSLPAKSSCCNRIYWNEKESVSIQRESRTRTTGEIQEKRITGEIKGVIIEGPWEVFITQNNTDNNAVIEHNVPESKITTELRPNGYLHIRASSVGGYHKRILRATIHASVLEKIEARGAATINTDGQFASHCDIKLSGASKMDGLSCEGSYANVTISGASKLKNFTFTGERFDADVSGASKIDFLEMNVKKCKVDLSGASSFKGSGYATKGSFSGSGSSAFKAFDLELENLDINLSGASSAEVTVNQAITGSLSSASILRYRKAEDVRGVSTSGSSKIVSVK